MSAFEAPRVYGDGTNSSINQGSGASQIRTDSYIKKALIEARELQYFMPLADVTSMPKNMGKKMKRYHYVPMLDDANINDQGIDAAGLQILNTRWDAYDANGDRVTGGTGWTADTATVRGGFDTEANAKTAAGVNGHVNKSGGALYGSSKDIGVIPSKMPDLSETGGRVNRVGFTRKEIEGTIAKYGFFQEYTQESLDFDTDAELLTHISREMINGAHEMTEDLLQVDLLTKAEGSGGTVRFAGTAGAVDEIDNTSLVDYDDLLRLHIDLNNNRTPMKTKVITGTRLVDTKTIAGGRVMYIGSELQPTLEAMTDLHGNPAFTPVHQYAAGAGSLLNGEIGSIGHFRLVVVPKMLCYEGAGAGTPNAAFWNNGSYYNVYPMLVVGDGSFSTIGFQTDGKVVKFKIYHKKPGEGVADRHDPYGETGFMSIKWYYGFMLQRPERLGLILTAAKL